MRRGGLDSGLPRRQRDRWILLHAVASRFGPEERLDEIDATGRIGDFLALEGVGWKIDRAALRRALVDEGFLERDPAGTNYRRSVRHRVRVTFEDVPEVAEILGSGG